MTRRFLACALLCVATPACYAADLLTFYKEATVSDPTFASARAGLLANREKIPQGRSLLLPQVTLNANILYNSQTVVESPYPTVDLQYPSRTFTLQLTQPLFRWANWQTYKQDELLVAQAEAQYAQAEEDLILRVAQAYFDVLNTRDTIDFLKAQKQAISEQLESAKRNFDVGTATITDTNEAEARYDLADAQEIAAQSDYEIKQAALQQIVGHPPGVLAALVPGVHLAPPAPAKLNDWLSSAEASNPQIAQSEANFQASERQIEIAKSARYPSLDVIAERQFQRAPTSILPPELGSNAQNSIGIQLSVPLFTGGYNSSKITEALALSDKANDDLEASRRAADQSVRQAFVGVTNGLAQVKALEAAEVSSNSALESNKLGYQVGIRINIDVLNAQQQLYSTKRDLAKARYDTLMNSLKLKAAAGTLSEGDVVAVNVLLQH
jgi:outer membrane protein